LSGIIGESTPSRSADLAGLHLDHKGLGHLLAAHVATDPPVDRLPSGSARSTPSSASCLRAHSCRRRGFRNTNRCSRGKSGLRISPDGMSRQVSQPGCACGPMAVSGLTRNLSHAARRRGGNLRSIARAGGAGPPVATRNSGLAGWGSRGPFGPVLRWLNSRLDFAKFAFRCRRGLRCIGPAMRFGFAGSSIVRTDP